MTKTNIANKRKRKKQQNKKREKEIAEYKKQIKKHHRAIWYPPHDIQYKQHDTESWFDIQEAKNNKNKEFLYNYEHYDFPNKMIKCKKVIMKLNTNQRKIMDNWLNAYSMMYNETLKFIKDQYAKNIKITYDYKKLRTNNLKDIRNYIIENSGSDNNTRAKVHNIDNAIKLACASYKSCLTNYKRGNIKHFRIRYWRHNREIKTMEIEKSFITKKGLCHNVFGNIKYIYNGKNYELNNVESNCRISYNKASNQYIIYIPHKFDTKENDNPHEIVSLDPGIRTFMTGISENEIIKIANDTSNMLKPYLKRIDRARELEKREIISRKKRSKIESLCNRKITGLVDELHWKTIRYLSGKYKNILIGDMSVKGITNKETSKITKMTKRIAYRLKFYQFRQRLEYKCNANHINYIKVNESYTSKICSKCGFVNDKLGSNKIYNCPNCKIQLDRDINGARGILIKTL